MSSCDQSFDDRDLAFDNAVMEAFWGRLQTELLNTKKRSTTLELTAAMADHIDNFHNAERRHSYLGNISPSEYEKLWARSVDGLSSDRTWAL